MGGAAPRSHLDPYMEVLLSLSLHCTEPLSQWLQVSEATGAVRLEPVLLVTMDGAIQH